MAAAAVKLAARIFPSLRETSVLFIGAGRDDRTVRDALRRADAARDDGREPHARARPAPRAPLQRAGDRAARAARAAAAHDIVVSCTASSLPILGKGTMERVIKARRHAPVFMVDLAVPRDIEPEVARARRRLPLHRRRPRRDRARGHGRAQPRTWRRPRRSSTPRSARSCTGWKRASSCRRSARCARAARSARRHELERALRMLARGDDPQAVLEALSHGLTNKLLHAPTQALHDAQARRAGPAPRARRAALQSPRRPLAGGPAERPRRGRPSP